MPAGESLRIEPYYTGVAADGVFTVRIVQRTDIPTSGASATIVFDQALLQVQSVVRATPYASAPVFAGAGSSAIEAANSDGHLVNVAAAFLSPDNVPAGEADFLDVTFRAVGCGTSQLGLPVGDTDAGLLDGRTASYGNALTVSTLGGWVTTCTTPTTPQPSPSSSPSPTPSPSPSATPPPGNSLRIEPTSTSIDHNGTFSVRVVQHAEVPTGGITATLFFDPTILQVTSVTRSNAYAAADFTLQPRDTSAFNDAISEANATGALYWVKAQLPQGASLPAGEEDFITVQFKAIACGATPLLLPNDTTDSVLLDGRAGNSGTALAIRTIDGNVQVCAPQATSAPALPAGPSIRIEPFYTAVVPNGGFTVRVVQHSDVPTGGITATIVFDPTILKVVSITKSSAYQAAPIFAGASDSAIAAANVSGKLNQVAAAFLSPINVPAGGADFVSIEFKAIACGETSLLMPSGSADSALTDGRSATYGAVLRITAIKGVVHACDPHAVPTPAPTSTPAGSGTEVAPVTNGPGANPAVGSMPSGAIEPPSAELSPTPSVLATASSTAAVLAAVHASADGGQSGAFQQAAFVGLGLAAVIAGLGLVLSIAGLIGTLIAAPWVAMRFRARRELW